MKDTKRKEGLDLAETDFTLKIIKEIKKTSIKIKRETNTFHHHQILLIQVIFIVRPAVAAMCHQGMAKTHKKFKVISGENMFE